MAQQSAQPALSINELTGNPNIQEHTAESFGRRLFENAAKEATKQLQQSAGQNTVEVSLQLKARTAPNGCFYVWDDGFYVLVCGYHRIE